MMGNDLKVSGELKFTQLSIVVPRVDDYADDIGLLGGWSTGLSGGPG